MKNNHVQGFDAKWDDVLLSMTPVPDDGTLQNVQKQLQNSGELKPLMALYLQDTVQKRELPVMLD